MVSSISGLRGGAEYAARNLGRRISNACATDEPRLPAWHWSAVLLCCVGLALPTQPAAAQTRQGESTRDGYGAASVGIFLTGAVVGLLAHEGGHLLFDVAFDADPRLERVEFHGLPFFAIAHRPDLSPRREFVISSAGFWVQHAASEWLLTRQPRLRGARAPFKKGLLAFNVIASAAYSGAAFARTGPQQRDTFGMSQSARIDERWVGALILAPAVLDAWRYFDPDARWPVWLSRGAKVFAVLLVLR